MKKYWTVIGTCPECRATLFLDMEAGEVVWHDCPMESDYAECETNAKPGATA